MTYRLNARPEVATDIFEAADWYEHREPSLGAGFTNEVRQNIRSLRLNPLLYRIRHSKYRVRWVLLRQFPYRIVFVVENDLITVLASPTPNATTAAGASAPERNEIHPNKPSPNPFRGECLS